jgi:hypothetical protein
MVGVTALMVLVSSCGDSVCVPPSCPPRNAFDMTVTTPAGTVVPGLAISVSAPSGGTTTCVPVSPGDPTYCAVVGSSGTYQLSISAPGFKPVQQTVQVTSSRTPGCDICDRGCNACEQVDTQHLSFSLTPS